MTGRPAHSWEDGREYCWPFKAGSAPAGLLSHWPLCLPVRGRRTEWTFYSWWPLMLTLSQEPCTPSSLGPMPSSCWGHWLFLSPGAALCLPAHGPGQRAWSRACTLARDQYLFHRGPAVVWIHLPKLLLRQWVSIVRSCYRASCGITLVHRILF